MTITATYALIGNVNPEEPSLPQSEYIKNQKTTTDPVQTKQLADLANDDDDASSLINNESPSRTSSKSIRSQFQKVTQTPITSTPVNKARARTHRERDWARTDVPLSDESTISIDTGKLDHEPGESIEITVTREPGGFVSAPTATLAKTSTKLSRSGTTAAGSIDAPDNAGEHRISVTVPLASETLTLGTTIRVNRNIGQINGLDDASIEGNELVLPVEVAASEDGFYRIAGMIKVGDYGWVNAKRETQLGSGDQTMELAIHGSALSPANSRNDENSATTGLVEQLTLTQLPAKPGDRTWRNRDEKTSRSFDLPSRLPSIIGADYKPSPEEQRLNTQRKAFIEKISNLKSSN